MDHDDRGEPANPEIEFALIGAIIRDPRCLLEIAGRLRPDHFYDSLCADLYKAIIEMQAAGQRPDAGSLAKKFEADERMATLGKNPMAHIIDFAGLTREAPFYSDQVIDFYKRRAALLDLADISARLHNTTILDEPANELLNELVSNIIDLESDTHEASERPLREVSASALENVTAALERRHSGRLAGLTTGLDKLDNKLGGFIDGRLYIIAGRTSMGKTALAVNAALRLAQDGHSVWFRSLEMSGEDIVQRWLALMSAVSVDSQSKGTLTDMDLMLLAEKRKALDELPLHLDDSPPETINRLAMKVLRAYQRFRPKLMIVDYLQLLRDTADRQKRRYEQVGDAVVKLKGLAKQLRIPIVLLCQIGRQVEDRANKRPLLSDLRESGNIEQDSDVVALLYRSAYYEPEWIEPDQKKGESQALYETRSAEEHASWISDQNHAEIIIAKNRQGPTGTVHVGYEAALMKFYEGRES